MSSFSSYVKGSWNELTKHVTWLTRPELANSTATVTSTIVILAIILYFVDYAVSASLLFLYNLFTGQSGA